MKKVTPPSNKKKRLYKMLKHLGTPNERWWNIDTSVMSHEKWQDIFERPLNISAAGLSEVDVRRWVDGLHSMGFDKERAYWLGVYDNVYLPLVEQVMKQAQQGGFGLKTLSSVYVGSRNFPVWTDCWIAPCGVVVFTETRATDTVGSRLPSVLRSAFRPAPSVDIPTWMMAEYYASRSVHYAERFGLSLSEAGEGWSCGDVTKSVDVSSLQTVLASDGEIVGRGLIEWVTSTFKTPSQRQHPKPATSSRRD